MINKHFLGGLVGIIMFATNCFGAANENKDNTKEETNNSGTQVQKVIDEYKAYVSTIDPKLREEIIAHRKELAKLNREKRDLYQKLSQEAQNYMAKVQEFKKRLPAGQKKRIDINNLESTKSTQE